MPGMPCGKNNKGDGQMNYTKAQMLEYLRESNLGIHILPLYRLKYFDYVKNKKGEAEKVIRYFRNSRLIIRSSSKGEDTAEESGAGKYHSILNVKPETDALVKGIDEVFRSYGSTDETEEVLIQPMLERIICSGVAFTADLETSDDYYIINYQEGSDTQAVTSGKTNCLKTFYAYKKADFTSLEDQDLAQIIQTCRKIEEVTKLRALDIEFAVTADHKVYILQARPIAKGKKQEYKPIDLQEPLKRIYKKIQKLSKPHPFLLGETTCFGVMPDWNPAEILGIRPKKLSISLYKELVTDSIWAHQRHNYGYRDLTMHPLMVSFCGIPYIDTRITFNSFVPKNLNEKIAGKLVNYYLKRLETYPAYHDKIEFEIVFSCYYLGISDKLKVLLEYGFNENELKRIEFSLLELTNQIIHPETGLYKKDIEKIKILERNYNTIIESDISLVDKIYWLIEECKTYGTLPFAGVARAGFIAVQFMRSFVDGGIITKTEMDKLMNSMETINREMGRDWRMYREGTLSKEDFLVKYGHIRPGTYDILSPRYDETFETYFTSEEKTLKGSFFRGRDQYTADSAAKDESPEEYQLPKAVLDKIQLELEQNGLNVTARELLAFIKEAIEGREYLKFVFTKAVSHILKLVKELGVRAGIGVEDMAYLDISVIKQLYVDLYYGDISSILRENIENNRRQYEFAKRIKLPGIIVKPEDVYRFFTLQEEPNFVTQKSIAAKTVELSKENRDVENKIVFIQSADPGYDFLFTQHIAGLITQFGGANSHMAIRCAELGIPAVIGAGEQNYNQWKSSEYLEIDCCRQQVLKMDIWAEG